MMFLKNLFYDTIDRRNDIFHFIRRKRETHLKEIMDEFGINRATAIRDIRYISDHIKSKKNFVSV